MLIRHDLIHVSDRRAKTSVKIAKADYGGGNPHITHKNYQTLQAKPSHRPLPLEVFLPDRYRPTGWKTPPKIARSCHNDYRGNNAESPLVCSGYVHEAGR